RTFDHHPAAVEVGEAAGPQTRRPFQDRDHPAVADDQGQVVAAAVSFSLFSFPSPVPGQVVEGPAGPEEYRGLGLSARGAFGAPGPPVGHLLRIAGEGGRLVQSGDPADVALAQPGVEAYPVGDVEGSFISDPFKYGRRGLAGPDEVGADGG